MTTVATTTRDEAKPQAAQGGGGVKETIEQILVAFILAFVFRCYIVEAFVIPTGSMAPTLLGAHMNFRCPDCGWHFSVNYNAQRPEGLIVPDTASETFPVRCPNCGFRFPLQSNTDPDNDASNANVQYGDRILVQKYIYLVHEPNRWDVVVFKNPDNASPGSERYQDNFIKRLIGLPGETLMILDGDIYTSRSTAPTEQLKPSDFTVQTKTDHAQQALWRIVYDNDYRPRGLPRVYKFQQTVADPSTPTGSRAVEGDLIPAEPAWRQPWAADNGWDTSGTTFRYDGLGHDGGMQFDTTSMAAKYPLTDWLAYDVSFNIDYRMPGIEGYRQPGYDPRLTPINYVNDVKLAVSYRRLDGSGDLRLSTTKRDHLFTAVVTPDAVRLEMRVGGGTPTVIGGRAMHAGKDRPARVELTNADYRVTLKVDDEVVAQTTPQQFAPDVAALLQEFADHRKADAPRIRIEAADQKCELSHVGLWRDVYYLNDNPRGGVFWAIPSNFPNGDANGQLMRLGPDEFFVLGDNSMLSGDARCWRMAVTLPEENLAVQAGRVPRRFMLGRAFFVYWPAGFAPVSNLPAFVPNFGEMRFIH